MGKNHHVNAWWNAFNHFDRTYTVVSEFPGRIRVAIKPQKINMCNEEGRKIDVKERNPPIAIVERHSYSPVKSLAI